MLKQMSAILWPSFLVAIVAEGVIFSLFDPLEIVMSTRLEGISPLGVYTLGFFLLWAFCGLASWLTYYLTVMPGARRTSMS